MRGTVVEGEARVLADSAAPWVRGKVVVKVARVPADAAAPWV